MSDESSTGRKRQAPALLVIAAVIVIALLAILGGGGSHGRTEAEKTFLVSLGNVRGDDPDGDRLQLGRDICHLLRSGESPGAARRYFGTTDPLALSIQLTGSLSAATAAGSLCPDQSAVVERWAGE